MPGSDPPSRSGSTYRIAVIRRSATTITVLARSRGRCGTRGGGNEDRDFGARAAEPTSSDPSEWWDAVDATRGGPRTCRRVAARRHARRGTTVLGLPARAVLLDPLRLLRLQHLHRGRARSGREPQLVRRPGDRRGPARPSGARRRGPAGADRLRRGWHADAAAQHRPGSAADRCPGRVRAGRGRRGHHRGEPGLGDGAVSAAAAGRGLHPGVVRDAEHGAPCARGAGPHPHPGTRGRGGGAGAVGRVRARQPRPDLRHAGGDRARLRRLAAGRGRLRRRPRVGIRAHRGGGHPAGGPDPAR